MKAVFEKIQTGESGSVVLRKLELTCFDAPFHFHPECELTLILKGEGQRYVGHQVADFREGDLVFLGPNVPHCWVNEKKEVELVSAIVIQFDALFAGKTFFDLPEMKRVKQFLTGSGTGFRVMGQSREKIQQKMQYMLKATPLQRLGGLLEILEELSTSEELIAFDLPHGLRQAGTERFQKVFSYLIEHFREEISLEEVAALAGLTPTSFCRYFKGISGMTFSEAVNDYRLEYACRLLQSTELPVQEVAFEAGFADVPHFNRLFRRQKWVSPKIYRMRAQES